MLYLSYNNFSDVAVKLKYVKYIAVHLSKWMRAPHALRGRVDNKIN